MKQYLIQYLNIVVGVLATWTLIDTLRIDRINYINESITQKQQLSRFPHAGLIPSRGLRKH